MEKASLKGRKSWSNTFKREGDFGGDNFVIANKKLPLMRQSYFCQSWKIKSGLVKNWAQRDYLRGVFLFVRQ